MRAEDLRSIAHFGCALWADSGQSQRNSIEAVTAVSLLNLNHERSTERASGALLERALRDGTGASGAFINRPFFRLAPDERFILSALHVSRWSYERIGRILKKDAEEIERLAWEIRLRLVASPGQTVNIPYPTGSDMDGVRCPEYHRDTPWTQRFLDDELTNRERIFLQNHLMACDRCRLALSRCRQVYYLADALVPRPEEEAERLRTLQRALGRTRVFHHPNERTVVESLKIFCARRDIQLLLAAIGVFVVVNLVK